MDKVDCPYCGKQQEINHDDGQHYDENEVESMQCSDCEKYFMVSVYVSYDFDGHKSDCLNDGKHNFELSHTIPREYSKMICSMCYEERQPTKEERVKYKLDKK